MVSGDNFRMYVRSSFPSRPSRSSSARYGETSPFDNPVFDAICRTEHFGTARICTEQGDAFPGPEECREIVQVFVHRP